MKPLEALFLSLAEIFNLENRQGAHEAAKALREASKQIINPKKFNNSFSEQIDMGLNLEGHLLNALVHSAAPYIKWGGSDLREGRIPEDLANQMPMAELVGPDGLYFNKTVRVGLWLQNKDIVYGPRQHEAEETFFIFNGEASWWTEEGSPELKGPNTYVFHPSNILHTSVTKNSSVFTAWRWSGDVRFEKYKLHH